MIVVMGQVGASIGVPVAERIAAALERAIRAHSAWRELEAFGANLHARPISREGLLQFLASTSVTFREAPQSILHFAVRVTDDWIPRDRYRAQSIAAKILYSAVDEYGLHEAHKGFAATHSEVFLEMARRWGFSERELLDPSNSSPEAFALTDAITDYYRNRSVPEAAGFHVALERLSDREFQLCWLGFRQHWKAYELESPDDPTLEFYGMHTEQEPMHGTTGLDVVTEYATDQAQEERIYAGAAGFMEPYERFFADMNRRLFA
jgi:hypothetical protein